MGNFLISTLVVLTFLSTFSPAAHAQNFFSEADSLITIRSIGVLPVHDNVDGIYSRSIEAHIVDAIQKNHRFEYSQVQIESTNATPDQLEQSAELRAGIFKNANADALISAEVIKNAKSIQIKMDLFLSRDRSLLLQRETSITKTDTDSIKGATSELLKNLFSDLPYQGAVLSRQGTKVTVNLGRKDGIEDNQLLTVIQVIKLNRHPKFQFLIGSEKETIGKIKVLKVDDTLSFGRIVTEKESGIVQVFSKISGIEAVTYKNTNSLNDSASPESDPSKALADTVTYGENPNAWLPEHLPTFGKVGAALGIGFFTESVTRTSDSLDADGIYPFFALSGEAWLTSQWSAHIGIRQGIFSADNPVSGASPSTLSRRLSSYELLFGYNFRLGQSMNSPKIELLGGYSNYEMYSDTSTPAGLTTKNYSGLKTGVSGSYPVEQYFPGSIGAELFVFWATNMKETPSTSGSSDNKITQFSVFAEQDWKTNLRFRYALDFELYSSSFSGTTTSSASQKLTNLSAGIAYYF